MKELFPYQEKIGRLIGFSLFCFMIFRQFYQYFPQKDDKAIDIIKWVLVTILFILFLFAYIYRKPAKALASGPLDTILPLFSAGLPFAILLGPQFLFDLSMHEHFEDFKDLILELVNQPLFNIHYGQAQNPQNVIIGLSIMAFGELITVIGVMYLRSSFSIFTEVRELIRNGIYRWVRHPLYLGEILSVWGFVIAYPVWWTLVLSAVFTIVQSIRAKREEHKISQHFPEYADYRKQAGFLWPKLF